MGRQSGPRRLAEAMERDRVPPGGDGDRTAGYGVLGVSHGSGDVLAFRRATCTSFGPPFTSVWHRDPDGRWTFYVNVEPSRSCPRFYGSVLDRVVVTDIDLRWTGIDVVCLAVPDRRIGWSLRMRATPMTRVISGISSAVPGPLWALPGLSEGIGRAAGRLLGARGLRLGGRVPNGQRYRVEDVRVWRVEGSAAVVDGRELGPPIDGPPETGPGQEDHMLPLPERGLFVAGRYVMREGPGAAGVAAPT